jgi:proline racemase
MIHAVDVWAAGGPHRIVTGGLPPIKGRTLTEKQQFIRVHLPEVPGLLTTADGDPKAMVAAILTEPCDAVADIGVIWVGCGSFMNLCGTGTFALGTALVELGMLAADSNLVEVTIEIPLGLQKLRIEVEDGRVCRVAVQVSPAYLHGEYRVHVPDFGEVPFTLAFGINCLEPLIDCDAIGIALEPDNVDQLVNLAVAFKAALLEPGQIDIADLASVQLSFYQNTPDTLGVDYRCMAIVGQRDVDTTPSGTSTCAHLAARYSRGELPLGEDLTVESINGGRLVGRVVEETQVDGWPAVIPEICGSGRIRRIQTIID